MTFQKISITAAPAVLTIFFSKLYVGIYPTFLFPVMCPPAYLGVESAVTCSTMGGSEDRSLRALTRSSSSRQPLTNSSSVTSPDSQKKIFSCE